MTRDVTVVLGAERYRSEASVGPHVVVVDEPADVGGGDSGPTPVELLLTSLASCKAITARMYVDRKGWDVSRIEATARVAAQEGHVVTRIDVEMRIEGSLSDEQRARVLAIAEQCPVQKSIGAGVRVDARVV